MPDSDFYRRGGDDATAYWQQVAKQKEADRLRWIAAAQEAARSQVPHTPIRQIVQDDYQTLNDRHGVGDYAGGEENKAFAYQAATNLGSQMYGAGSASPGGSSGGGYSTGGSSSGGGYYRYGGGGYGGYGGYGGGGGGGGGMAGMTWEQQKAAGERAMKSLQQMYESGAYRLAQDQMKKAVAEAQWNDTVAANKSWDDLDKRINQSDFGMFKRAQRSEAARPFQVDNKYMQSLPRDARRNLRGDIAQGAAASNGAFNNLLRTLHANERAERSSQLQDADLGQFQTGQEIGAGARAANLAAEMMAAEGSQNMMNQMIDLSLKFGLDIPNMTDLLKSTSGDAKSTHIPWDKNRDGKLGYGEKARRYAAAVRKNNKKGKK